jgi:anti-sigma B factor antagonist
MIIKTREIDNIVVFDVEGEIRRTDTAQETLHSLVEAQLDRGRRNVLLNLGGVEFIDSFGVGQILASYISTQNLGGRLKLCQITMLTTVLEIHEDCDRALESFRKA